MWIDVETLLPVRWEVGAPSSPGYGLSFTYETLDIRVPDGVAAPSFAFPDLRGVRLQPDLTIVRRTPS